MPTLRQPRSRRRSAGLRCPTDYPGRMQIVKSLVKGVVIAKVVQVAQRELSKPENQRKAREALKKFRARS